MSGWRRWWRFNGIGLAGIGVQLATLAALVEWLAVDYRMATALAVATAVAHNFAWHRRWTWADRAPRSSSLVLFLKFASANGLVSLVGNMALMTMLVGAAGVSVVPANVISIVVCGLVNYWFADSFVFSPAAPGEPPRAVRDC